MIYLDFSKAFDKVSHHFLIRKLSRFGKPHNLLTWFKSYLSDRYQRVTLQGTPVVQNSKKGNKEQTENYRPISLLPIVSKVLERCIFNNIRDHLFQRIHINQDGFLPGKSCVTNLLDALEYIGSILDQGGQVDTIYLDMSKAFDRINHQRLLHKLTNSGIGGNLLKWFQSY